MIYCDTSFLLPLYVYEAGTSEKAGRVAAAWKDAGWVSPIGELELTNAVCRKIFEKEISSDAGHHILRDFRQDLKSGIFRSSHLNLAVMFRDAAKLSWQHTPEGGHRSLDILHVSAAKLLGATRFLSFDVRLNRLAKAEGMKLMR
jgi:predicted nucleic acid-binding protein